jgi:polyisoprenoid-binding protein YceI
LQRKFFRRHWFDLQAQFMVREVTPMKNLFLLFLSSAVLGLGAVMATTQTYKIAGERNSAIVENNTNVENFTGRTSKVTGEIRFNPTEKTGSGTIVVDALSITTGIGGRDSNMRSERYMNFARHPQIRFETSAVRHTAGDDYQVTGRMTMSGKTVTLTVPATLRLLPASAATRELGLNGDVVNLRTRFQINLPDFGVNISSNAVSKTPTIQLNVFASNQ